MKEGFLVTLLLSENSKFKISFSCVNNARNVIVDLHKRAGILLAEPVKLAIKINVNGYARNIGDLKQKGDIPFQEGKEYLHVSGYRYLTGLAFGVSDIAQFGFDALLVNIVEYWCSKS